MNRIWAHGLRGWQGTFAWILVATALLPAAIPNPAKADQYWKFIAESCVPEINFFQVRTLGLYNVLNDYDEDIRRKQDDELHRQGLYLIEELQKRTFVCLFNNHTFEIGGTYQPGRDRGECGANQDSSLWLKIDGKVVHETDRTHGGCFGSSVSLDIQMNEYGADWCTSTYSDGSPFGPGPPRQIRTECNHVFDLQ